MADGLIDFKIFNPQEWTTDNVLHIEFVEIIDKLSATDSKIPVLHPAPIFEYPRIKAKTAGVQIHHIVIIFYILTNSTRFYGHMSWPRWTSHIQTAQIHPSTSSVL